MMLILRCLLDYDARSCSVMYVHSIEFVHVITFFQCWILFSAGLLAHGFESVHWLCQKL